METQNIANLLGSSENKYSNFATQIQSNLSLCVYFEHMF